MKELLVPVGSMDALIVAIKSGADAVYLGGKKFGARAYANNFDNEEMVKAIKLCHLYGVKIYVTVNTLVYESEFVDVVNYAKFLHESGVDALIVQDIGLISYLRRTFPNLEIHASTQVHNTNREGIKYLEELGVSRVVLARELSIDEINNLDINIEKEVFIHGALCISYSGQCLFSSCVLNRSGNKGVCAQVCRLPYKLAQDDKIIKTDGNFLLSPKELNTSEYFERIMESDIVSLKIEGRMKSPEYVGCVTKLYRKMINYYYETKKCIIDKELLNDLSVIYNRDYTKGFLFNSNNEELMNIKTSNHLGVFLGKVIEIDKKYIHILLNADISQGDGVRFMESSEGMICNYIYNKDTKLINSAKKGEVILLDRKFDAKVGENVNKTLDINIVKKYRDIEDKKIEISAHFVAKRNNPLVLTISDGENEVRCEYGSVMDAINAPITKISILKQLSKLGNTPFFLNSCDIDIDDQIFINIKDLNELRRKAILELINIRENKKKEVIINDYNSTYDKSYFDKSCLSVLVRDEEQMKVCLNNNIERIYVANKSLYEKYKNNKNVLFRTRRVNNEYQDYGLITELGALKNKGIGDYFLNVTNHETINALSKYLDVITLSVELSDEEIANIMNYYKGKANLELVIRSNLELMIMKYCPLNMLVNKDSICHVCTDNHKYYLVDRFDKKYRILSEPDIHLTHILNHKAMDKMDNINFYKNIGIRNFRIELLEEKRAEVQKLIDKVMEVL